MLPKKQLGQHWLYDEKSLSAMLKAAQIKADDNVLEIGPGLGTLTEKLLETGAHLIALEFDQSLIPALTKKFAWALNLELKQGDVLKFDFSSMPEGYKIAANIPYYLTSHLFRILSEPHTNKPAAAAVLVQKEVAERVAAKPGDMSILSVAMQLEYETSLGMLVPAELFTPPPKVDSQILVLEKRREPLYTDLDNKLFMRIVKAGFAGKRKTLRNSISAGLHLDKQATEELLKRAGVDSSARAQNLSLDDWHKLYAAYKNA